MDESSSKKSLGFGFCDERNVRKWVVWWWIYKVGDIAIGNGYITVGNGYITVGNGYMTVGSRNTVQTICIEDNENF